VLAAQPEDIEQRLQALRLRAAVHLNTKEWEAALENTEQLLSERPDDAEVLLLRANALVLAERAEEAEGVLRRIWETPSLADTPAAARAGVSLVRLLDDHLEQPERAEAQLEDVLERFPTERAVLGFTARYFKQSERPERATELMRSAVAREPNDLGLRGTLAQHLVEQGEGEEAERLLVEATEIFANPAAWITLTELYRAEGKYEEALVALEQTLDMLPGVTDYLRFKHADLLAVAGHLDRAEEVAEQISETAYREIVAGRIAYDRGDAERALERLDAGLRRWPNHGIGRYLAGMAALKLGRLERAQAEFREAARVEPGTSDAALKLARIQLYQGNPRAAFVSIARLLAAEGVTQERRTEALVVTARAQSALGQDDAARETLKGLQTVEGQELRAALELAELEARAEGPTAAIRSLEESQIDLDEPGNEAGLRALCEHLIAAGRSKEALERVDSALRQHPEFAAYHDVRARVVINAGRPEDAKPSFERALELDPELAPALAGLALIAEAEGELEQARSLLARAAGADALNASYPYQAAQLELAAGHPQEAEVQLREALRRDPLHAQAANDLAWLLAERGEELDLALELALRARQGDKTAEILDTLGWVRFKRGNHEAAVASLRAAHALQPDSPSIAYRLGLALAETGEVDRARLAAGSARVG
jgi:tetratricopeptide (TPR) repeat protein